MNEYYSVFRIINISWINTIWYSVFRNFYEQILFSIRYSVFGNVSWTIFGIWKFFMNEYYSVFGNSSWTNIFSIRYSKIFHERILFCIRYSEILHERIYSKFGIRSNSLFGATLIEIRTWSDCDGTESWWGQEISQFELLKMHNSGKSIKQWTVQINF